MNLALQDSIYNEDCLSLLPRVASSSVDLILSDIPYGIGFDDWDVLHENTNSALLGSSPAQQKAGAIFKKRGKPLNGWSEADRLIPRQYYDWCGGWAGQWLRVLKPGSSAFIFAGRRLSHRCTAAMEDAGFTFKDMLGWQRGRAAHRAQRLSAIYERRGDVENSTKWNGWKVGNLRPLFEPILWFTKPYEIGTTIADNVKQYSLGAYNESALLNRQREANNMFEIELTREESGFHPNQKPLKLMKLLIELTTVPGQFVLDPFCGSGSTLLAAKQLSRHYCGFELDATHFSTSRARLEESDLFNGLDTPYLEQVS